MCHILTLHELRVFGNTQAPAQAYFQPILSFTSHSFCSLLVIYSSTHLHPSSIPSSSSLSAPVPLFSAAKLFHSIPSSLFHLRLHAGLLGAPPSRTNQHNPTPHKSPPPPHATWHCCCARWQRGTLSFDWRQN